MKENKIAYWPLDTLILLHAHNQINLYHSNTIKWNIAPDRPAKRNILHWETEYS